MKSSGFWKDEPIHQGRARYNFRRNKGPLPPTAAAIENKEYRIDFWECIWNCRWSALEISLAQQQKVTCTIQKLSCCKKLCIANLTLWRGLNYHLNCDLVDPNVFLGLIYTPFIAEAQDVNWKFIARLNCGSCLLTDLHCTSFCLFIMPELWETVSLERRDDIFDVFLLFSFSVFFHCLFDLLCAAFSISSNMYQAPWLLLWWNQWHHLTPISYINDKGECLKSCCLRFMLPAWGCEQKNGGILVDLLASAYFLFASGKLP